LRPGVDAFLGDQGGEGGTELHGGEGRGKLFRSRRRIGNN
jgi:hypothetical protein